MKASTPLGAYIRQEAKARDMTLTALAQAAGLLQGSLHRIASGVIGEPRITTMQAIANALGVPLTDLIAIQQGKQPEGGQYD